MTSRSSSPEPISSPPNTESTTSLSKNARKRLLKAERSAASKAERRARDKEKRKEKQRERAEKRRAGDIDVAKEQHRTKRCKVEHTRTPFHARIVVDLAFDDKMSEKEVVSLCSQLAYTYSLNRKARTPFAELLFTSLDGKTLTRLEALGGHYKRWHGVEFWNNGYENLWHAGETGVPKSVKDSVVYLTGDAEDELNEIHEGETYIIGGICDRNRYKNLCLNKAKEQSIRSARLPIGKYLTNLPTRKILTVNQVFDILLHWTDERDWSKAIYAVMPKRKFQQETQSVPKIAENGEGSSENADETNSDEGEELQMDINTRGPGNNFIV